MKPFEIKKENFLRDLKKIQETSPLIHNITNYVVMNNTANALLAVGASPVMAHALEEVEQMVGYASALVINIGTLEPQWVQAMLNAGKIASKNGTPIILDPVGAGATTYRTESCISILNNVKPNIIRGNASEIIALANACGISASSDSQTKGVDSTQDSADAIAVAMNFAKEKNLIISISGPTDYITDGERVAEVHFGSTMLTKVTGLGCTASAITGAFAAVNSDTFEAAAHAMLLMGCAGQRAASYSKGNGSLQLNFLDELCNFDENTLNEEL